MRLRQKKTPWAARQGSHGVGSRLDARHSLHDWPGQALDALWAQISRADCVASLSNHMLCLWKCCGFLRGHMLGVNSASKEIGAANAAEPLTVGEPPVSRHEIRALDAYLPRSRRQHDQAGYSRLSSGNEPSTLGKAEAVAASAKLDHLLPNR